MAAYPISPQTHIVEGLSDLVTAGDLAPCEYLLVESEFGALSACIGASAAGARAYTATSSQGLLFMAEALPNASGLGLPIVMTVANRALGAPINIWNDHSDALSQRDAGWIQLFASSNQEAVDLHVQAFALAERLSLPVMVCMDGFVLTHAMEEIDVPDQDAVDAFLPPFAPRQWLDPDDPVTIGAMVGPGQFTEVKYLMARRQLAALDDVAEVAAEFGSAFGRDSGGLLRPYRTEDAEVVLVAMGSVLGTAADVVDGLRDEGIAAGVLGITCYRPWPHDELRDALREVPRAVVVNRAIAVGAGSILGRDVRLTAPPGTVVHDVVMGLGGRPVTRAGLRQLVLDVLHGRLEPGALHFVDLDETHRSRRARPRRGGDGPVTTTPLYQIGTFAAGNRLLDPDQRSVQSDQDRTNAITSGHRACRGCGEALAARVVLDAASRAAGGRMVTVNATGCLEVFSTPYPESAWQLPWLHSLFGNAAAVASGVSAALRATGRDDIRVVAQAGDGGTVDIGLGCLSGMFERNDDVLFVCYDNQGYMNTGVQRSGATPPAASTATTRPVGDVGRQRVRHRQEPAADRDGTRDPLRRHRDRCRPARPRGEGGQGDVDARCALPARPGAVPARLGVGVGRDDPDRPAGDPVRPVPGLRGRARRGHRSVTPIRQPVPVSDYLRPQTRFAHLFRGEGRPGRRRRAAGPRRPQHRPLRAARPRRRS